jgi:hypothetical protein
MRARSTLKHTSLVKSTLLAIPIHTSIAVLVSPSIFHAIDKLRHTFIWSGSDAVQGGQCLVAWSKVTLPTSSGHPPY